MGEIQPGAVHQHQLVSPASAHGTSAGFPWRLGLLALQRPLGLLLLPYCCYRRRHHRWEVKRLLTHKAKMVPWRLRERELFMRGDAGVGYRKTLMPFMHEVQVGRAGCSEP